MPLSLRPFATRILSAITAAAVAFAPSSAFSASTGKERLPIVRDAEIEALVEDYAGPLLKVAGLSRSGIEIVLLNRQDFNAFVAGRRIFINTGTILAAETPNEVIGVLAHEIGHLAGGHQQRLRDQIARAQKIAIAAGLFGAGIAAAGAAAGQGGLAQVGGGIFAGGGDIARRLLFRYQRSEETTADRSALTYLEKTGQSPAGLLQTFERLARASALAGVTNDPYVLSHPLPRERIALLQSEAQESPHFGKADDPALQLRHDLARAKIAAYTSGARAVSRTFRSDPRSLPATYGDAILTHLSGSPAAALKKIDALVEAQPRNPWFHEIRGEILMQSGKAEEAAAAFARAVKLDDSASGLLQASIGQALVTGGKPDEMKRAIAQIRKGLQTDPDNATAYRFLAMAYGKIGDIGAAELATAEGHWHAGAFRDAKVFAARAQQKLKPGSPLWLQAQDIITSKQ